MDPNGVDVNVKHRLPSGPRELIRADSSRFRGNNRAVFWVYDVCRMLCALHDVPFINARAPSGLP